MKREADNHSASLSYAPATVILSEVRSSMEPDPESAEIHRTIPSAEDTLFDSSGTSNADSQSLSPGELWSLLFDLYVVNNRNAIQPYRIPYQ